MSWMRTKVRCFCSETFRDVYFVNKRCPRFSLSSFVTLFSFQGTIFYIDIFDFQLALWLTFGQIHYAFNNCTFYYRKKLPLV